MKLSGKTILVTGASSGIGAATAREAHRRGATVLLVARSAEPLQDIVGELGDRAHAYPCDVSDAKAVAALAKACAADGRQVDVLVNNAGAGRWLSIDETDPDELLTMAAVPYHAAMLVTRAFVQSMIDRRNGWIVNVNSPVSQLVWPGAVGYASARWALRGFNKALAADLRGTGVRVSEVVPGKVSSSYFEHNPGAEERIPSIARIIPTVTPEQVAKAVCDAVEKERREVVLPWQMKAFTLQARVFPEASEWLLWRTGHHR